MVRQGKQCVPPIWRRVSTSTRPQTWTRSCSSTRSMTSPTSHRTTPTSWRQYTGKERQQNTRSTTSPMSHRTTQTSWRQYTVIEQQCVFSYRNFVLARNSRNFKVKKIKFFEMFGFTDLNFTMQRGCVRQRGKEVA